MSSSTPSRSLRKIFKYYLLCFSSLLIALVESFLKRPVGVNSTTISFDFDTNMPPATPIVQQQSSSPQPIVQTPIYFRSADSTSSGSVFCFRSDSPLYVPFITTPEATLSLPMLSSASLPFMYDVISMRSKTTASPYCPCGCGYLLTATRSSCPDTSILVSTSTIPRDPQASSTPLSLLPVLRPSQPNDDDNNIAMSVPQHWSTSADYIHAENDNDSQYCLSAFEMVYMNQFNFERFIASPEQPQSEFEIITELSPYDDDDNSLIYTQL